MLSENVTPEQLLSYLSPDQQKAFEEILKDPRKAGALLDSAEARDADWLYWWQLDSTGDDVKGKGKARPTPLERERLIERQSRGELPLSYNLLAIMCVASAHKRTRQY